MIPHIVYKVDNIQQCFGDLHWLLDMGKSAGNDGGTKQQQSVELHISCSHGQVRVLLSSSAQLSSAAPATPMFSDPSVGQMKVTTELIYLATSDL